MVRWLRIHLHCRGYGFNPWSGNWDPTCCRATKALYHNYWSMSALGPVLHNKRSHCNRKAKCHNQREASGSLQLEKAHEQLQRPSTGKNKWIKINWSNLYMLIMKAYLVFPLWLAFPDALTKHHQNQVSCVAFCSLMLTQENKFLTSSF